MTRETQPHQTQEEISPESTRLQELTRQALKQMIEDPEMGPLWQRFRYTYEERNQRRHLRESGENGVHNGNGLAYALTELCINSWNESRDRLQQRNQQEGMFKNFDEDFKKSLMNSVEEASRDEYGLDQLEFTLEEEKIDQSKLTVDKLKSLLTNGLNVYWEQTHAHGFSGDPW